MQRIQDKELDKLFQSAFEEAEIEPSSNLWGAIEEKITPGKKRRLPIFWMAAASVAVVLTLTMVFNKNEKIQLQKEEGLAVQPAVEKPANKNDALITSPVLKVPSAGKDLVNRKVTERPLKAREKAPAEELKIQATPEVIVASTPEQRQDQSPEFKSILPPVQKTVIAQADAPVASEVVNDNDQERKGIRNVGDLVNYVVDKVDKRDRKAIRFKTEDEGSSLVGINIGFLKFNSRKK